MVEEGNGYGALQMYKSISARSFFDSVNRLKIGSLMLFLPLNLRFKALAFLLLADMLRLRESLKLLTSSSLGHALS